MEHYNVDNTEIQQDTDSYVVLSQNFHTKNQISSVSLEEIYQNFSQWELYFVQKELQKMHQNLPEQYQLQISHELLARLANCLQNNPIFDLVEQLINTQHETEIHLMQIRKKAQHDHQLEIVQWESKIKDPEELEHILSLMKIKHDMNMEKTTMELVLHLDHNVKDQQKALEEAGVPGFHVTDDPNEIKIQMLLLDFILRLSKINFDQPEKYE
ncbi:gonadal protein gdl-like [Toxorhynchites rutilus septentrionalis]|uniref:gonadal protein gdl-like n=1 Tax=Toxorhynchites rutilus septentrionalis TaxID=329112 RepID=UPI00247AF671|nr:gonadal protein gdl-like [Toxorhynchites rutilus septentrionalis]